jgi:hypothetical protein
MVLGKVKEKTTTTERHRNFAQVLYFIKLHEKLTGVNRRIWTLRVSGTKGKF